MKTPNVILMTDAYKASHFLQYPEGTTSMFDYIEARKAAKGVVMPEVRFFGLQYILKRYLLNPITVEMVDEAEEVITSIGLPFNRAGWMHIVENCGGKLPVRIRAVPEGSVIPHRNVLVTIESTDSVVPWLVGYLETLLLKIWYPSTVATLSYKIKLILEDAMEKTSDDPKGGLPFKLNDFGYRASTSEESAGIGGLAHLINFEGSDTIAATLFGREYYGFKNTLPSSLPASEHSTMTSWGRLHEKEAYNNMLEKFSKPGSIFAVVSDSYDYYKAVDVIWGQELKEKVISSGGTLVIRPDSGSPLGNVLWTLDHLANAYGYTMNSKGYKVLNNVRIIQGDGLGSSDDIYDIIQAMIALEYSVDNVAFGMGSGLLQGSGDMAITRDTFGFACKTSSLDVYIGQGLTEHREVYKSPILDQSKLSKKGRLDLIKESGEYKTVVIGASDITHPDSVLRTVYENGELLIDDTLAEIRNRA